MKANNKKNQSLIIGFNEKSELSTFFKESNNSIYDAILNSIEIAIDKKVSSTIPFVLKKKDIDISCLLILEKSKWKTTLDVMYEQFVIQEKYEFLRRIKVILTKLNDNENKNLLSSKNGYGNNRRQWKSEKNKGKLSDSGSFVS